MKVIEQKIRSLYHSTVFLLLVSEFLHICSFFRVCLCGHFVCFSPVFRPRNQILPLFILAAILNKFPLSVDKSITWFLLCARVFSPAAAILESEKALGTRLIFKLSSQMFCKVARRFFFFFSNTYDNGWLKQRQFAQMFGQSSLSQEPHFWLTSVAQKRLCL